MAKNNMDKTIRYSPHYRKFAEGHIYLGDSKQGTCAITLTGAAAMTQKELNRYGKIFAKALKEHD